MFVASTMDLKHMHRTINNVFHGLYYVHVHLTVYSGTENDRFKFNWKRSNTKDTLEILSYKISIYKFLRKKILV